MAGYQILGIRSFFDEKTRRQKKFDAFYEKRWRFDDIAEVFRDPKAVLDRCQVPIEERWNLYYTVNLSDDAKRKFLRAEIIPFDLDGIDVSRRDEYIPIVLAALRLDAKKIAVVFSGNGLHFIVKIYPSLDEKKVFQERRAQYRAICGNINSELERLRLPGKADPAVFDAARILRFPATMNVKPDKQNPDVLIKRECVVLQPVLESQPFDWEKISGVEKLDATQAIPIEELRRYKANDGKAALEQCLFLKQVKENPSEADEPELYAALSIIGRFDNGKELAQEIFAPRFGHRSHGGSAEAIAEKTVQAVGASGPRTCDNINNLWGKCDSCPLYQKIKSPVVIFGADVIPTEATGFYDLIPNAQGVVRPVPNYGDLLKAFGRDFKYFTHTKIEKAQVFDSTHWRAFGELEIQGYAERMFSPAPKHTYRNEFARKVLANFQRDEAQVQRFLRDTVRGKLNLKNGVLDVETGELLAHSHEYGFTYVLPYDYDASAKAPTFLKFLDDITCHDKDLATTLLDYLGYLLIPSIDDHCFLWLAGSGRNGKSTFMDIMRALVGQENSSSVMLDQFDEPNAVEMMNAKLVNISEESDARRIPGKITGILKALSAGGQVQVHQKYELPYSMIPTAKLVFASNVRPKLEGASQALASRMILVPFRMQLENYREKSASKVDATILTKMKKELPGILNLALERVRMQAGSPFRVHRAKESDDEVQQIFVESDPMEAWLEDACDLVPGAITATASLYASYKKYMEEHHSREFVQAIRQFSSSLRAKLPGRIEKVALGHDKVASYRGISLKAGAGSDY